MESDSDDRFSAVELNEMGDGADHDHADSYRTDEVTVPAGSYQCLRFGIAVLAVSLLVSTVVWVAIAVIAHIDLKPSKDSSTTGNAMTNDELRALASSINDSIDTNVDPCDDFYEYACGSWVRQNQNFPADRTSWYRSFTTMAIRNERVLQDIVAADWPLISPFYQSCMNTTIRDALGARPIQPWMDAIRSIRTLDDVAPLLARLHLSGIPALFDADVSADFENPLVNILTVSQGGIGLPTRDHYLRSGERDIALQRAYLAHLERYAYLANLSDSAVVAENAYAVERLLANSSLSPADLRNPYAVYHIVPLSDLQALAPSFNWAAYFSALGLNLTSSSTLNVAVPSFFSDFHLWFTEESLPLIRDYLSIRTISASAKWLSTEFLAELYEWGFVLQGAVQPPQQRVCQSLTNSLLGELLGRYYVMEEFDPLSKEVALNMILRIEDAFMENLPHLGWMDNGTAKAAIGKMKKIVNKIGYPDSWYDYGDVSIKRGEFFQNWQSVITFMSSYMISQFGRPVDRSMWYMYPQTVNAYYNPTANEMVFPAAILQPTFFNAKWPIALNFGGIGMVMGHELTHGFDDQGRLFDGDGKLSLWWEQNAIEKFNKAADCVVDLYSNYSIPLTDQIISVNGKLTLGENIADMGGVKMSYHAFRTLNKELLAASQARRREYHWPFYSESLIESVFGHSSEQLFFISMAQNWCSVVRGSSLALQVASDPHSPSRFRVNGPLSQSPEFAAAFQCAPNKPMSPSERCTVW